MKLGHVKPRNTLAGLGKLLQVKTDGLVMKKRSICDSCRFSLKISRHTISQRFSEMILNSRFASTRPYISKKNKMSRLNFATEHVTWTEEQWNCTHFRDESKFNLLGCDGRRFVRQSRKERYSPQCIKSSVKFGGGSVMVFNRI